MYICICMYGFYYHFNNLRFKQTQSIDGLPAAHIVISLFELNI